jgi:GNAT superfamily N-acetyltransferase
MHPYTIRPMTVEDAPIVGRQREAMFLEANKPQSALDAMREPFLAWLHPRLIDGTYLGWAVEHEGEVIGGAGLFVLDWPPHYLHPEDSRRGYLLNVYVDAEHRGHGLARRLVEATYEGARNLGIAYLVLHASELGRPVYERMGWQNTNEMGLLLPLQQAT